MQPTSINSLGQSPPDSARLNQKASIDVIWHSPVGIFTTTPEGRFTFANPAMARIYGYPSPAELIASITDISNQIYADPEEREIFQQEMREKGELINREYRHLRRDGSVFWVSLNARAIYDEHGELMHYQGFSTDITGRKHVEEQLQKSEEEFRNLYDEAPVGYFEYDLQGNITRVNHTYLKMLGYTGEEMVGQPCWKFIVDEVAREQIMAKLDGIRPPAEGLERTYRRKDGNTFPVLFEDRLLLDEDGHIKGIRTAIQDITARKRAETYREMGREILQILNEPGDLHESIQRVLTALKTRTGLDAVGLRLQEGEDFPYFVQDGFSRDFLLTENTLLERKKDGGVCRDKDGNVRLECTCGLVISGKTDPSNPLFTKGGSSWTNDSFPLLDLPSDQDPRLYPRNNCIHQGYASVALIPIRTSDRTVGLIQFNDKRKGRFTLELIEILEIIAAHVGSAMIRKQAEDELKSNYALLQIAGETAKFGGWSVDLENNICTWSDIVADIHDVPHGYAPLVQEAINFYAPEWQKKIKQIFNACTQEGISYDEEMEVITQKGKRIWVRATGKAVKNEKNKIIAVHGSFQDITDKKHTERALKESEERFNLAMDASRDGVFEWDLETRKIYYSPGWKRMLGYGPDELPDDFSVWEKLTRPKDVEKSWQVMKEVLEGKRERFEVEFEMRHKDGHWVHILSRSNIYKDKNGKPVRVVGTHVDITESKHQRERLRLSDSRYKKAQTLAKVGNWEYNLKTRKFWGSDETKKIFGLDADKDIFSTEAVESCIIERERVHQALVDLTENGEPYNLEYDIIAKNTGKIKTIFSVAEIEKDKAKNPVKISGVIHDITERKRTEEELRRRENQLQRIFEILPIGLWFADKDGTLLRGNPKGIEIWGAEPTVPISEYGVFKAWHLPSRKPVRADEWALARTIRDGETIVDELLEIKTFDGKRKTILNYTAPVLDGEGQVDGAIIVNLDISERKALEDQLLQAQKLESVGRLAGGVAHDFNNMLGVILGHTEMALDEIDPAAPLYASLQAVQHAAERSADLTRQLLAFARKQTIAPKVIDINDTVEGMLNMLRRLIGENINLLWQPGHSLQPVKVDPSQLDQLLANLCVNARDAIAGVGNITIETDAKTFDEDYCADHLGFLPGEYVLLEVSDDGCGMDKKTLNQIFEPFFTTKEMGQGTGLGLASVFGMVKQNNGFINVYSEPAQGTTFKIYLPAYAIQSDGVMEKAPDLPAERGNETILLVEDESAILQMTTMMLEKLGYTVVAAASPGEAIRLAHEHRGRIDLLMTDVVMPEMNGRDLAGLLLSHYPDLNRLFMSGYTANVIAHHGVLDEGVHFIQKPFSMKDLGGKLREALKG